MSQVSPAWGVKYRPKSLKTFIGNDVVRSQIESWAKTSFPQFIVISGPTGTGKTTLARIIAEMITEGEKHPHIEEINAVIDNGIEFMRNLAASMAYAPTYGKYKIAILDEAHMITRQGASALLKVLEEPPAHAVWIFATDQPSKLLPTIRGRAATIKLSLPSEEDLIRRCKSILKKEKAKLPDAALQAVIDSTDRQPRLTLNVLSDLVSMVQGGTKWKSALQQALDSANGDLKSSLEVLSAYAEGNTKPVLQLISSELGPLGLVQSWIGVLKYAIMRTEDAVKPNPWLDKQLPDLKTSFYVDMLSRCSLAKEKVQINGWDPFAAFCYAFYDTE